MSQRKFHVRPIKVHSRWPGDKSIGQPILRFSFDDVTGLPVAFYLSFDGDKTRYFFTRPEKRDA